LRREEHELEQIFDVAQTIFDSDSGHVYDFATLEKRDEAPLWLHSARKVSQYKRKTGGRPAGGEGRRARGNSRGARPAWLGHASSSASSPCSSGRCTLSCSPWPSM